MSYDSPDEYEIETHIWLANEQFGTSLSQQNIADIISDLFPFDSVSQAKVSRVLSFNSWDPVVDGTHITKPLCHSETPSDWIDSYRDWLSDVLLSCPVGSNGGGDGVPPILDTFMSHAMEAKHHVDGFDPLNVAAFCPDDLEGYWAEEYHVRHGHDDPDYFRWCMACQLLGF